jgi:hypothetical protein
VTTFLVVCGIVSIVVLVLAVAGAVGAIWTEHRWAKAHQHDLDDPLDGLRGVRELPPWLPVQRRDFHWLRIPGGQVLHYVDWLSPQALWEGDGEVSRTTVCGRAAVLHYSDASNLPHCLRCASILTKRAGTVEAKS